MSERFAPGALRLYSHAASMLGWRPDDFWSATPAELAAALAPPLADAQRPVERDELNRLMERDND